MHNTARFTQAAYSGGTSSACRQTNVFCVLVRLMEYPELLGGERSEEEEEEEEKRDVPRLYLAESCRIANSNHFETPVLLEMGCLMFI